MTSTPAGSPFLEVRGLSKFFPVEAGLFSRVRSRLHAVDDISFDIRRGETLALVGESGCGKTTTAKLLLRLLDPTGGTLKLYGGDGSVIDLTTLHRGAKMKSFRRRVQMIFQDPYESLNPRMSIYDIVEEPLLVQRVPHLLERQLRVSEMLHTVGLTPASSFLFRLPRELSGGQRQRVAIARALILDPEFVVADEPTSMLDASVRAGVMNLMLELAERLNTSYLFITHDLAVARYMSEELAVMYLGKIVETGPTEEILSHSLHPYTRALLSAVPVPDPHFHRERPRILGGVTRPIDPPPRCRFYERCPISTEVCRIRPHPPLEEKDGTHRAACHLL
jgi:oligopeptide/dipeptide ABC transporter ATP-binding protein